MSSEGQRTSTGPAPGDGRRFGVSSLRYVALGDSYTIGATRGVEVIEPAVRELLAPG